MKPGREKRLDEIQKFLDRRDYKSAKKAVLLLLSELLEKEDRNLMDKKSTRYLASALLMLGTCEFEIAGADSARPIFEDGLNLAASLQDNILTAVFLHELSLVAYRQGRMDESLQYCEDSISGAIDHAFVEIGQGLTPGYVDFDLNQLGGSLNHLAVLCQETNQFDKALDILIILKAHCERVYNLDLLGAVLGELGLTCFAAGKYAEGVRFFFDSIKTRAKQGNNSPGISRSVLNLQACLAKYPAALQDQDVSRTLREYRP